MLNVKLVQLITAVGTIARARFAPWLRGGRYVLIIHFYVESGQKMIQFNIQFKIESKIFIQWIIHSIFSQKYRFNELFIQYSVRNIDSKFYSKNWIKTIQIYVIKPTQWKPAKRERFPKIVRTWGLKGTFSQHCYPNWRKKCKLLPNYLRLSRFLIH